MLSEESRNQRFSIKGVLAQKQKNFNISILIDKALFNILIMAVRPLTSFKLNLHLAKIFALSLGDFSKENVGNLL